MSKKKNIKISNENQDNINYLNEILPVNLKYNYEYIKIDSKYVKVGVIKSYPSNLTTFGSLAKLAAVPNVSIVQKNTPLSNEDARSLIDRKFKINNIKRSTRNNMNINESKSSDSKSEKIFKKMSDENETLIDSTTYFVFYADTIEELKETELSIKNTLSTFNATYGSLEGSMPKAYRSTLLNSNEDIKGLERTMLGSTLSKLFPYSYGERLDPLGILIGYEKNTKGLILLDAFDRKQLGNGNTIVFGMSGEGKSFLMKKTMSWEIAKKRMVWSIDSDNREYGDLVKQSGGSNVSFTGKYFINVFQFKNTVDDILDTAMQDYDLSAFLPDENEDDNYIPPKYFGKNTIALNHIAWLRDFFAIYKKDFKERTLDILETLLTEFYNGYGLLDINDLSTLKPTDYPIAIDFFNFVERKKQDYDDEIYNLEDLKDILIAITSMSKGTDSLIFNGHTNLPNNDVVNFDISDIIERKSASLNATLFNIFMTIWERVKTSGNREKVVFIDELYLLVNDENDLMTNSIKEIVKRIRKYFGRTVFGTQNISDLLVKKIAEKTQPIISNATIKFIFHPGTDEMDKFAKLLKCSQEELDHIKKPSRGDCLCFAGDKKYFIHVQKMDYEDALFGDGGGA